MTEVHILSSLSKIFPDEICNRLETESLICLKRSKSSFQLAVKSETENEFQLEINSPLSENISIFTEKYIPSLLPCYEDSDEYFIRNKKTGEYPDCLIPETKIQCKKNQYTPLWFEINIPENTNAGDYKVTIKLKGENEEFEKNIILKILPALLNSQSLKCTNWFHSDCLINYYHVDVFSEEYWRIIENYLKTAKEHGINMILTPLFTPPLDTKEGGERTTVQLVDVIKKGDEYSFSFDKLERWINLCNKVGIEYFEFSHLFTQWGAKHAPKIMAQTEQGYKQIFGWKTGAGGKVYASFIRQLGCQLKDFINKAEIGHRCFFHVSDEPSKAHLVSYRKASKLINEVFGEYRQLDALGDYSFYKLGYVKTPIPDENNIEKFAGNVPELWTYYCCGQHRNNTPNRFFAMPSLRNRILGIIMYKYNVKGFLQWGYNFWNSQYSIRQINPFEESDAGKAFPSGDSYVVYPAPDGTPYCSLRLKVFYDAIQDFTALLQLQEKIGREQVLNIIENDIEPITVNSYPHSEEWLTQTMETVYKKIAEQP